MKKLIWLTDVHLDHLENKDPKFVFDRIYSFCKEVKSKNPDGIAITGDITNATRVKEHFQIMINEWKNIPVYFVLGNHDYYGGNFKLVDSKIKEICDENLNFHYMNNETVLELTPTVGIVGHSGWYDGLYANWWKQGVVIMNDYFYISDFFPPNPLNSREKHIFETMQKKAQECHDHILNVFPKALEKYNKVFFLTHVPPFEESCRYNDKKSDWRWMPNFSSELCGRALLNVAKRQEFRDKEIVVLCGHTHGKAEYYPTKNMVCYTGYSDYGFPLESLVEMEVE